MEDKLILTNYDLEKLREAALQLHKDVHFRDVPVHLQATVCFIKAFADFAHIAVEVPGRKPYETHED